MGKFNSCINRVNVQSKSFPGSKEVQLDHRAIPILLAAGKHVGISNLLNSSSKNNIDEIRDNITKFALKFCSHNIAKT